MSRPQQLECKAVLSEQVRARFRAGQIHAPRLTFTSGVLVIGKGLNS